MDPGSPMIDDDDDGSQIRSPNGAVALKWQRFTQFYYYLQKKLYTLMWYIMCWIAQDHIENLNCTDGTHTTTE